MATFKYVGSNAKSNGKIDIRVGNYEFLDIEPGVDDIIVPDDSQEEKALEFAQDPLDGTFLYIKD